MRALVVALAIGGAGGALALPMLLLADGAESPTRFAHSLDPLAPEQAGHRDPHSTRACTSACSARDPEAEAAHNGCRRPPLGPSPSPSVSSLPHRPRPAAPTPARPAAVMPKPSHPDGNPEAEAPPPLPSRRRRRSRRRPRPGTHPTHRPEPTPEPTRNTAGRRPLLQLPSKSPPPTPNPPAPFTKAERAGDGTPQEAKFWRGDPSPEPAPATPEEATGS